MMMTRTSSFLVPIALCAAGIALLFTEGCRKEQAEVAPAPSSTASAPESYMRDAAFRGDLKARRVEHGRLVQSRNAIAEKMRAMIEAKKAELKTEDLARVKAALEGDSAWQALYVQCTNANAAITAHRRETLGKVRERILPGKAGAKPVSK